MLTNQETTLRIRSPLAVQWENKKKKKRRKAGGKININNNNKKNKTKKGLDQQMLNT